MLKGFCFRLDLVRAFLRLQEEECNKGITTIIILIPNSMLLSHFPFLSLSLLTSIH